MSNDLETLFERLIAKLVAAPAGSRVLDEDIARYLAHKYYAWWRERAGRLDFTQSVDAAMTLLPEPGMNRCWGLSENPDRRPLRRGPCCTIMLHEPVIEAIEVFAPTPPLAITIAALRAIDARFSNRS